MKKSTKKHIVSISKYLGIIGATLVFIFIALILWAGDDSQDSMSSYNGNNYDEVMRSSFMDECNSKGNMYSYCSCTYNYLDSHLTRNGWLKFEAEINNYVDEDDMSTYPVVMQDAIYSCIDLL
ncbi:MAG: hypothetical protein DRP97_00490 [Candidatus Latescibacterota bacterium]|nr:MAG: hypothetical protein DRP97_00490 [Candidatus Latescibacterota bacterium]